MPPRDFSKYQGSASDSGDPASGQSRGGYNSRVFQSRNLMMATYDPQTSTLTIHFVSGRTYEYYSIPPIVWSTLRSAIDPDDYFRSYIVPVFRSKMISGGT